jgi:hypothetical protein
VAEKATKKDTASIPNVKPIDLQGLQNLVGLKILPTRSKKTLQENQNHINK